MCPNGGPHTGWEGARHSLRHLRMGVGTALPLLKKALEKDEQRDSAALVEAAMNALKKAVAMDYSNPDWKRTEE